VGVTKTAETDDEPPIPPLRRPLGVPDVPTTRTRTLEEMSADFLDQEKQLKKRRHLCVVVSTWMALMAGPHVSLE
jgi:hypothetical protein